MSQELKLILRIGEKGRVGGGFLHGSIGLMAEAPRAAVLGFSPVT